MTPIALSQLARLLVPRLINAAGGLLVKFLLAVLRWYCSLSLTAMFFVTAIFGALAIAVLPSLGINGAGATLEHGLSSVLVAWLLIVIIFGVIRSPR